MNKRQVVALWVGIGLMVLMGVVPPWVEIVRGPIQGGGNYMEFPCGYYLLVAPPKPQNCISYKVDTTRLVIQFVLVALVMGGAILTLKVPRQNRADPEKEEAGEL